MSLSILKIPTAKTFEPLLQPACYEGAFDSRGSGKTDALSTACIEAIIPLAKLVVNRPQANAVNPSSAGAPDSNNLVMVKEADGKADLTTDSPPVAGADDGVVTAAAKLDVVLIALQGPALQLGCGAGFRPTFSKALRWPPTR